MGVGWKGSQPRSLPWLADRLTDCGRQVLERVLLGLFQPPAPVLLGLVGQWHREVPPHSIRSSLNSYKIINIYACISPRHAPGGTR